MTQEFLEQTMGATGRQGKGVLQARVQQPDRRCSVDLVRIEKTKVDGDHATVTVVLKRQGQRIPQELRLKKEDGDWKLAGGGE